MDISIADYVAGVLSEEYEKNIESGIAIATAGVDSGCLPTPADERLIKCVIIRQHLLRAALDWLDTVKDSPVMDALTVTLEINDGLNASIMEHAKEQAQNATKQ